MRSYAHGTSPIPLLGETIGENLWRTVERYPDRDALVVRSQGYRATYRQLYDATSVLARALIASGIEPRDRVGIWSPNRFEWVVTQFATARAGAILVNINPAYKSAELGYALRQSGVKLLLLAKEFRGSDYVALLREVRPECPDLLEALVLDDDQADRLLDRLRIPFVLEADPMREGVERLARAWEAYAGAQKRRTAGVLV